MSLCNCYCLNIFENIWNNFTHNLGYIGCTINNAAVLDVVKKVATEAQDPDARQEGVEGSDSGTSRVGAG